MKRKLDLVLFVVLFWALSVSPVSAKVIQSLLTLEPPTQSLPHPILSDVSVRKAISLCTDKSELIKSVFPLLTTEENHQLIMDSFLPSDHWAYDNTIPQNTYNPAQAAILLNAAGWSLTPGDTYRKKNSKELTLTATSTTAAFRTAYMTVWESQMKSCGIRVIRNHQSSNWFFGELTGLQVRDFELGLFAWVAQLDPGGETLYSCDTIPTAQNNWYGQNYSGWCNSTASNAIIQANQTLIKADRIAAYHQVQQGYGADVPAIPLFRRPQTLAADAHLTGLDLSTSEEYYTSSSKDWQISGQSIITIGLTQEPTSFDKRFESSFVSDLILELVNPRGYTNLDYGYQPVLLTNIPTLESGLTVNSTISVTAGDTVLDASGYVQTLAPGMKVVNKDNDTVTFSGTPIQMKQLTVQFPFKSGIKWSDGQPLTKADFQLGYQADCDPSIPNIYYCSRIDQVSFADDNSGYTVKWLPGYQSSDYFVSPFQWYPAHQLITSGGIYNGKKLAEIPISAWADLPEITDTPLGVGPYRILSWNKGNQVTLAAVSGYVNGNPLTQTIIFKFMNQENTKQELIDGSIDVVGWESLAGVTYGLLKAQTDGKVKIYNIPSQIWEHVDINLETFGVSKEVTATQGGTLDYTNLNGSTTQVVIPAGAVTKSTTIELYPLAGNSAPLPAGNAFAGNAFRLTASENGVPVNGTFPLSQPVQITLHYNTIDVENVFVPSLNIFYWNGTNWEDAKKTCPLDQQMFVHDLDTQTISLKVCHLTEFSAFGKEGQKVFIPVTYR